MAEARNPGLEAQNVWQFRPLGTYTLSSIRVDVGRTNERPGTDQVISRPMRDLKKSAPDGTEPQTDMATL